MLRLLTVLLVIGTMYGCKPKAVTKEKPMASAGMPAPLTDLKFNNKVVDFGKVTGKDSILTGRYSFVNTGANPLIISTVNPDCTCTGYYLSNDTIPPGDSAYILLKMATRDKVGNVRIYAAVGANTETRLYNLTLKASF